MSEKRARQARRRDLQTALNVSRRSHQRDLRSAQKVVLELQVIARNRGRRVSRMERERDRAIEMLGESQRENETLLQEFWQIGEALKGTEDREPSVDLEWFMEQLRKEGPGPSLSGQVTALRQQRDDARAELEELKRGVQEAVSEQ